VERGWQCNQAFTYKVEEEPHKHETQQAFAAAHNAGEHPPLRRLGLSQVPQASGANHPIVMLGDALPAKIVAAVGAARDRFTLGVIETPLQGKVVHQKTILGGGLGSSTK
jgi:hypothetical protein